LPFVAKTLRPKIIRRSLLRNRLPAPLGKRCIEIRLAQPDGEAIAQMNAPPQLARIAGDAQHAQLLGLQRLRLRRCLPRHVQAEPLARDCMAVLQPTVADQPPPNAHCVRQTSRSRIAVHIPLFRPHEAMLSLARRLKPEQLLHHKIFRQHFETRTTEGTTMQIGKIIRI
jgi:hypothetical protein